jgi:hypothetical protein
MTQGATGVNNSAIITGISGSNVSAFGDFISVNPQPSVQLDFVYGLNTRTATTSVVTTGVATTSSGRLSLTTGIGAAGSASLTSLRIARYRAGQGMMARFTAVWDGATANCTQVCGVGGSQVGYFFGFNGTAFGISIRNGGSDSWVAQTAWNGDKCDGTGTSGFTWDKTKGNVMQILYPFLGYGNITFWVKNSFTSNWILCHTIRYTNSSASLQVSNPSFPFFANVVNTGSTTSRTMFVGSALVAVTGDIHYLGASWGANSLKTAVSTELNIISIRNCTTYNTVANNGMIRIRSISFSSDGGNGSAVLTMKRGVTLGGVPAFTTINGTTADNGVTITSGNSIASFDVAGTTITGGDQIFNMTCARNAESFCDTSEMDLFVFPGTTTTFSVTSQVAADIRVSVNWNEDV